MVETSVTRCACGGWEARTERAGEAKTAYLRETLSNCLATISRACGKCSVALIRDSRRARFSSAAAQGSVNQGLVLITDNATRDGDRGIRLYASI